MAAFLRVAFAIPVVVGLLHAATASAQPAPAGLLDQFRNEREFWRQIAIAKRIAAAGDRAALAALEPWLSHDDRHVRGNAAFVFLKLGDARGLETLRGMLTDRSARPLGQGIAAISANLDSPGWWMNAQVSADRYYAVHLLGESREARAVPILVLLLDDPDLSYKAAWALGEIGVPPAIAPLIAALGSPDALTRVSAIR